MSRPRSEQRKTVRFDARLRLRYDLYEQTDKVNVLREVKWTHGGVHFYSDVEQQTSKNVKEGMTLDVSTQGVLFETGYKPELDRTCKLEILLPKEKSIIGIGKVVKVEENKTVPGVYKIGVEFTQITEDNINKICMWYYKSNLLKKLRYNDKERRQGKRFKVKKATLRYRKKKGFLQWEEWKISQIFEVSTEGILLKTNDKFEVDNALLVEIYFPNHDEYIKALGKVRRVRKSKLENINEVAINISKLKENDKKKLEDPQYLNALIDKADEALTWF